MKTSTDIDANSSSSSSGSSGNDSSRASGGSGGDGGDGITIGETGRLVAAFNKHRQAQKAAVAAKVAGGPVGDGDATTPKTNTIAEVIVLDIT